MKSTLIDYTGYGFSDPARFAMQKLVTTKNTRLEMNSASREKIERMDDEQLHIEIRYMANTIPSSWEFIDYTFAVEECSIACARQIMRTRHASFAQQSLRVVDASNGFGFRMPPSVEKSDNQHSDYVNAILCIESDYKKMISSGMAIEDARGILPLNMHTNFIMKIDMRNFVDLVRKRSSPRVQDEYREFVELAKERVLEVHPFVSIFLERTFDNAANELSEMIEKFTEIGKPQQLAMQKLLDQMRTQS